MLKRHVPKEGEISLNVQAKSYIVQGKHKKTVVFFLIKNGRTEQDFTSSRTGAKLGYSTSSGATGDPRSSMSEPDSAFDVSLIRSGN